jgi:hypothetical protein
MLDFVDYIRDAQRAESVCLFWSSSASEVLPDPQLDYL